MKKLIKTIGIITTIGTMLVGSYLLGTTQAEPITKIHTVTEVKEVIPDGYIDTNSEEFQNNYVDMRKVTYFEANDGKSYMVQDACSTDRNNGKYNL